MNPLYAAQDERKVTLKWQVVAPLLKVAEEPAQKILRARHWKFSVEMCFGWAMMLVFEKSLVTGVLYTAALISSSGGHIGCGSGTQLSHGSE